MIYHPTKSAWGYFKLFFPYTSELSTCTKELCRLIAALLGFLTSLLMTKNYIFNFFTRRIQRKNHNSNSELDIHRDLFLCAKNPGHKKFFPISKFRITDLPEGFQLPDIVNFIDLVSNLVVKITLNHISSDRPRGSIFDLNPSNEGACSYGSGYLWNAQCCHWHSDVICPCRICHHRNRHVTEWGELRIVTANHVVFDDAEARDATIELFYNDPHELSSIVRVVGLKVVESDVKGDRCEMIAIVHDRTCWDLLVKVIEYCYNSKRAQGAIENLTVQRGKNFLTVIVSHPHGSSKQVSVGRCLRRRVSDSGTPLLQRINYDYDTPTCPGSSGAPVLVFGCERHTVSFAPHTRWDQRRKRNASGHAFELEHSEFWVDPSTPRSEFTLRTILWNKHISKSQTLKLLFHKSKAWLMAQLRHLVVWFMTQFLFYFMRKTTSVTQSSKSSLQALEGSSEAMETISDTRTFEVGNQWNSLQARACIKQNHDKFIPFDTFSLTDLPPDYQDENIFRAIGYLAILTGKLTVFSTKRFRRKVHGTCYLRYFDSRFVLEKQICPCPNCMSSDRPSNKWAKFVASTAAHVLENFKDGDHYMCELMYDDEHRPETVLKLYGRSVLKFDLANDSCDFELVTHDMELCSLINSTLKDFWRSVEQLEGRWQNTPPPYLVVIPSHPHGFSKHVTVGWTVDDISEVTSVSMTCLVSDNLGAGDQCTVTDVFSLRNISKKICFDDVFPQRGVLGRPPSTDTPSACEGSPSPLDSPILITDRPIPNTYTSTSSDSSTPLKGRLTTTADTIAAGSSIATPNTDIATPHTDIPASNTDIVTPNTDFTTPRSSRTYAQRHDGRMTCFTSNGEMTSPNEEMTSPNGDMTSPNGEMTSPSGEITSPNGEMTSPNTEISSKTWKLPQRFPLNSHKQYKYTSATCPGSAGAPLFILKGAPMINVCYLHSGSRRDFYNMSSFTVDVNDVFRRLNKTPYIQNI